MSFGHIQMPDLTQSFSVYYVDFSVNSEHLILVQIA